MADLPASPINVGDPVTYDVINSIVGELKLLKEAQATKFNLNLTQAGGPIDKNVVSQKVYSTTKSFKSKVKGTPTQIKWDLTSFKFNNPPRVWSQLVSKGTYTGSEFKFMIQVLSVTQTQAIFEVRGMGFTDDTFNIYLFAVEA
jgi:hypothetical protein